MFTVHCIIDKTVIPLVYALLPNKRQETYTKVFRQLKQIKPALSPVSVLSDFEQAIINSIKDCFPDTRIRGCFFHFSQCIWREIQRNSPICDKYKDIQDPDFSLYLRQLAALAFVPEEDVIECFNVLLDSDFFRENEQLLCPLIDYIEDQWIGRPTRSATGRRSPRVPISLWNCYEASIDDLPKTNNSIEGWHRSFSSLMASSNPNFWRFLEILKKEEGLTRLKLEQLTSGINPPPSKRIYIETARIFWSDTSYYEISYYEDK